MNKLEELKQFVAGLFENATDRETISKGALAQQKISEIEEEQKKMQDDYQSLLKDYKDVVLHSSFKPTANDTNSGIPGTFNPEEAFNKFFVEKKGE